MLSGRLYFQVILILLAGGIYASARYVLFGNIYWIHTPIVILNKDLAVSSVFALMLSAIGNLKGQGEMARDWGKITLHLTLYHVFLSLMILTPMYYDSWFYDKVLNLKGNLVLSFGAFGTYCVVVLYKSRPWTMHMATFKVLAAISIGVHIFLLGWRGWFQPAGWYGHMPPITMWSTLFTLIALGIYLKFEDARFATNPAAGEGRR